MAAPQWIHPAIRAMRGYTPGEQPPAGQRIIKLNTNENPYPPPTEVLDAIRATVGDPLRRYPDPDASGVREAAARAYGLDPEQVVVGNGSDELITLFLRAAVAPGGMVVAPGPTYSLYATLVRIQGGYYREFPWKANGAVPVEALVEQDPSLIFIVRPNSPTGHACPLEDIDTLCSAVECPVVLDEAYADFAADSGLSLLPKHPNLVIIRTLSKGFSLAGLRVGLAFVQAEVATEIHKVRDSYNVDCLAQAGAEATLNQIEAFRPAITAVVNERSRLDRELRAEGFQVIASQANFLFARVPDGRGAAWYRGLKGRGILVRHFPEPEDLADGVRITVGTAEENTTLIQSLKSLMPEEGGGS